MSKEFEFRVTMNGADQKQDFTLMAKSYQDAITKAEILKPGMKCVAAKYTDDELAQFDRRLQIAIERMTGDDSVVGNVLLLAYDEGGNLTSHRLEYQGEEDLVLAMDRFHEYEVIIFDGGNKAGDLWFWTFYPKQTRVFFVDRTEAVIETDNEMPPLELYKKAVLEAYRLNEMERDEILLNFKSAFPESTQENTSEEEFLISLIEQDYESSSGLSDLIFQDWRLAPLPF
ncbi:MAG: hypothetical protein PHT38_02500 [Halothiobacillus sp.]|nr:hypothetical protein [Halothiobacillus sp.]